MQDSLKFLPEYLNTLHSDLGTQDIFILFQKLLITILIGAFIGLEREHSRPSEEKTFAGIRTFPLIAIFGFIAALISSITSYWTYFAFFIGFSALVTTSHIFSAKNGRLGGTSEITTFIVFLLGSLVYWNFIILASIIAVITTIFLTLKLQLHTFVGKVSEEDLYATLKLALITVIILPLLPDKTYGPLNVLNPRLIWYMVILVSGISFVGYVLIKIVGQERGIPLTGLMGGLVSSTVVTYSFARRSKEISDAGGKLSIGIILASTVMYLRVFIVLLIINISLIDYLWLPLLVFALSGVIVSLFLSKKFVNHSDSSLKMKNPFELKSALLFGLIFAIIILVAKAAQMYLGSGGTFAASALAGITSVDAITISIAKLTSQNITENVAIPAIIIALISNTIVKSVIALIFGDKELKKYTLSGLGVMNLLSIIYLIYVLI